MKADVILGLQWGDEGKGKIVDLLTPDYDIIARFQGGPNAGHTIEIDGSKYVLHLIPSGILHPGVTNLIGNGVILDPFTLLRELEGLRSKGFSPEKQLIISRKAHLILPTHRLLDACYELARKEQKIGSTLKGIGPAYTDKTSRNGLRTGDLFSDGFMDRYRVLRDQHLKLIAAVSPSSEELTIDGLSLHAYESQWLAAIQQVKELQFVDGEVFLNEAMNAGKRVLAEGAQGTLLDVDFGSYPFVTSSSTSIGGVCTGLGIPPSRIGNVFGVFKAYCTRVGNGPFPTELFDATGQQLRDLGHEYGSTTGRPRRCGWLDLPALRYAIMINGVTRLIMMKADVMNTMEDISICTHYNYQDESSLLPVSHHVDVLPQPVYQSFKGWNTTLDPRYPSHPWPDAFKEYIQFIEKSTNTKISVISLGPERTHTTFLYD